jgi:hypothetical protein
VPVASLPPAAIAGTWWTFQQGAGSPPAGYWRLVVGKAGWRIYDTAGTGDMLDVIYLTPGLLVIQTGMATVHPLYGTLRATARLSRPERVVQQRPRITSSLPLVRHGARPLAALRQRPPMPGLQRLHDLCMERRTVALPFPCGGAVAQTSLSSANRALRSQGARGQIARMAPPSTGIIAPVV